MSENHDRLIQHVSMITAYMSRDLCDSSKESDRASEALIPSVSKSWLRLPNTDKPVNFAAYSKDTSSPTFPDGPGLQLLQVFIADVNSNLQFNQGGICVPAWDFKQGEEGSPFVN